MTLFEENPNTPDLPEEPLAAASPSEPAVPAPGEPLIGDPISYAALHPQPQLAPVSLLPPDLDISWSWVHLICFLFFGFISLIVVQTALAIYILPHGKPVPPQKELEQFILSKPLFAIGSMVLWYALLFLFLYVTLTVLRSRPFWQSLGWRKLNPLNAKAPAKPWIYFGLGCALSMVVLVITATVKAPEHAPIQDILKYRNTAIAFMAMAVFIAPLVEETVFRGYLYPLIAKSFGTAAGIIITGILFGLMHGYQLGWTWSLVLTLIGVGVVFTIARARSGTVFASFLLHLGYNSTIAVITVLGLLLTKGGKVMPPHP